MLIVTAEGHYVFDLSVCLSVCLSASELIFIKLFGGLGWPKD